MFVCEMSLLQMNSENPTTRDGQGVDPTTTRDGQRVDPTTTRDGHEVDPTTTRDGHEVDPTTTRDGQRVDPTTTRDGQRVDPTTTRDGQRVDPTTTRDGHEVDPTTTRDGQRVDPTTTRDGQRVDPTTTRDGQRATLPASSEVHGTLPAGLGRSRVTCAGFSPHNFSDATPGDTFSQQHTRDHHVSEKTPTHVDVSPAQSSTHVDVSPAQSPTHVDVSPAQSSTHVDFSPAQIHVGNESSSVTTAGRLVEHLSEVNREGKESEYRMGTQREDNTRPQWLQSSCIRDTHHLGDHPHLQERPMQRTQEAVEKCEDSTDSISAGSQYHTTHNTHHTTHNTHHTTHNTHHTTHNSETTPDVVHSRSYNRSDPSPAEQQSERIAELRYKDKPKEEAIRLKRPRDYIRQWRDSIDRLSTVSVTDDLGAPVSPLISHYNVSFPRSQSLDAGGYTSVARSKLEDHHPLAHRSRSSHVLLMTDGSSQRGLAHSSNPTHNHSDGEKAVSTSRDRNLPAAAHLASRHRKPHQNTRLVSVYKRESDQPDVSETNLVRDNTLATSPPLTSPPLTSPPLTSHKEDSHLLRYRSQQTILNKRFRSEPSSSGSRVQFRPVGNGGCERPTSGAPVLTTSHRHHSLSPWRQTVGLPAHSTARLSADRAWELHPILSVPANYRLASPQQQQPTTNVRKQEVDSRNFHVSISSEVSPEDWTQLVEEASQQADPGIKVRLTVTDDRPAKIQSVFPDEGLTEHSHNTHLSPYPHVERGSSLPSTRRGGAGRVPRREAWEQEKRHRNEDGCVVGSDADTQCGIIAVLFTEIENLREKIELLERADPECRFATETQSASSRTRSVASPTYRPLPGNIQQRLLSDHISSPASTGHQRALSCPLLELSRRSHATRSLSRNAVRPGIVESKTASDRHIANLGWLPPKSDCGSRLVSDSNIFNIPEKNDQQNVDYNQTTQPVKPDTPCAELKRSFEPRHLVKWKQLISRHDLSQLEVIELKQAVACVLVENDILQSKLSSARQEVHDKLRHTNGVLEDCRQHLAQSQRENMQLRVNLKEEQGRNQACRSRVADLEGSILQLKTDNQQLQQELNHTAMLLDDSLTMTQPEIDDLKTENWRLASRLRCVQVENDDLRQEVEFLTQKQVKAVDTMDGLRKCLAQTRQEREELFDELATFKDEQKSKVREIIKNYQEKGSQDEWEKEQNQVGETENSAVSHAGGSSQVTRDFNCCPLRARLPRRRSKSPNSPTVHDGGSQHLKRSSPVAEIYPHRRVQTYCRSSCSPDHGRSSSLPGYSHPLSMDESVIDSDRQDMKFCLQTRKPLVEYAVKSSRPRLDRSRSPGSYRSAMPGSFTPRYEQTGKDSGNSGLYRVQHRHTRSLTSPEELTSTPSQYTHHWDTTTDNRRERQVAEPRSKSPSYGGYDHPDSSFRKWEVYNKSTPMCTSVERNSKNGTPGWPSPPTRLSPDQNEQSHAFKNRRRPRHSKTAAGEIARKLQEEFDHEDQIITLIANYPHNKSWFDRCSESEANDTGINSSMGSDSSYEHLFARKRAPVLTKEQRQYADQLVQKYTGQISHKQPA